jgi:hypothetical protein
VQRIRLWVQTLSIATHRKRDNVFVYVIVLLEKPIQSLPDTSFLSIVMTIAALKYLCIWSYIVRGTYITPGLESREYGHRNPSSWPHGTLYPQNLTLTSPTRGGLSVGIVCLLTQTTKFTYYAQKINFLLWRKTWLWIYRIQSILARLILRQNFALSSCQESLHERLRHTCRGFDTRHVTFGRSNSELIWNLCFISGVCFVLGSSTWK